MPRVAFGHVFLRPCDSVIEYPTIGHLIEAFPKHVVDFDMNLKPHAERLIFRVHSGTGKLSLKVTETNAGRGKAQPILVIHAKAEALIQ